MSERSEAWLRSRAPALRAALLEALRASSDPTAAGIAITRSEFDALRELGVERRQAGDRTHPDLTESRRGSAGRGGPQRTYPEYEHATWWVPRYFAVLDGASGELQVERRAVRVWQGEVPIRFG